MSSKITVIGAGNVGATIAYTLSNEDIASEIVLIDVNKKKVVGEVMDIVQGPMCLRKSQFCRKIRLWVQEQFLIRQDFVMLCLNIMKSHREIFTHM